MMMEFNGTWTCDEFLGRKIMSESLCFYEEINWLNCIEFFINIEYCIFSVWWLVVAHHFIVRVINAMRSLIAFLPLNKLYGESIGVQRRHYLMDATFGRIQPIVDYYSHRIHGKGFYWVKKTNEFFYSISRLLHLFLYRWAGRQKRETNICSKPLINIFYDEKYDELN